MTAARTWPRWSRRSRAWTPTKRRRRGRCTGSGRRSTPAILRGRCSNGPWSVRRTSCGPSTSARRNSASPSVGPEPGGGRPAGRSVPGPGHGRRIVAGQGDVDRRGLGRRGARPARYGAVAAAGVVDSAPQEATVYELGSDGLEHQALVKVAVRVDLTRPREATSLQLFLRSEAVASPSSDGDQGRFL